MDDRDGRFSPGHSSVPLNKGSLVAASRYRKECMMERLATRGHSQEDYET